MSSINSPPEKNADKKQKDRCPLVSLSCFRLAVRLVKKEKKEKKGCYSEVPLFDSAPASLSLQKVVVCAWSLSL